MKRLLPFLAALVAFPSFAAAPIKEADLPDIFKKEPPYIQNQVCGELLASMSRMSVDLYKATNNPAMQNAAIMTGTRAIVFVKATATLTKEELAHAKDIAAQMERKANAKNPSINAMFFCEERMKRWIDEGIVTSADMQVTEAEVRKALTASPSAKRP